jgi:uncharacterized repeat protein (TIGR01451 family)
MNARGTKISAGEGALTSEPQGAISSESVIRRLPVFLHRVRSSWPAFVLAVGLLVAPAGPATAHSPHLTAPHQISGPDPLPQTSSTSCGSGKYHQDWEFEPTLAVNPTDPANLVAAWIQDWDDAIVVGYSRDGGKSWGQARPKTTPCTGGLTDFGTEKGKSVIDPSLSFGPDGVAYLTSLVSGQGGSYPNGGSAAVVNTSPDGGETWSPPKVLDTAAFPFALDAPNSLADPAKPGYAYAQWAESDNSLGGLRHLTFARTEDGGATWEQQPLPIPPGDLTAAGRLLFLPEPAPDGTLVNVFMAVPPQPGFSLGVLTGPETLWATRSTDHGSSWSVPVPIATADADRLAIIGAAVGPDGKAIYVSWQRADGSGSSPAPAFCDEPRSCHSLMYSKSTDGGQTWQPERGLAVVPGPSEAGDNGIPSAPSVAVTDDVTPDGVVGVAFYDHRNDVDNNNPPKVTDLWFRHSHDGGNHWEEDHLAGPFDHTTAPSGSCALDYNNTDPTTPCSGGVNFHGPGNLGAYQGIAPIGAGFATAFALAKPLPGANFALGPCTYTSTCAPVDIFYSSVVDPAADLSLTMTDAPDPILAGSNLTYHITVSNAGPDPGSGVTVTDALPAGATFVSASASQGPCSSTTTVTCFLGSIASGAGATVDIVVKAAQEGILANTATVSGNVADPNGANNSATATTTVNPAADLSLTVTDSPDPAHVGQSLTYSITITNAGPQTATGVTVRDPLPKATGFGSASASQGTCTRSKTTVICSLGNLGPGQSATVTIVVKPTQKGVITNTATVTMSSPPPDPNAANNSETATTTVQP